jgi:hypothetical protein
MITIVKFKAYDKALDKNFYAGETLDQIHGSLNEICNTYVPVQIITAETAENNLLNELLKYQPKPQN